MSQPQHNQLLYALHGLATPSTFFVFKSDTVTEQYSNTEKMVMDKEQKVERVPKNWGTEGNVFYITKMPSVRWFGGKK
jgi:hypothetical protein